MKFRSLFCLLSASALAFSPVPASAHEFHHHDRGGEWAVVGAGVALVTAFAALATFPVRALASSVDNSYPPPQPAYYPNQGYGAAYYPSPMYPSAPYPYGYAERVMAPYPVPYGYRQHGYSQPVIVYPAYPTYSPYP